MTDDDWVATVLAGWRRGQALGAVGSGPVEPHLDHARRLAAVITESVPGATDALDLGSGAGIPGLALAGLLPGLRWTLLDASRRRTRLLTEVVDELGWGDRVAVVHGRAEVLGREPAWRGRFGLVVARLFGPPAVTAECSAPLVAAGGRVLVTEPPDPGGTARWPAERLVPLGLEPGATLRDPPVQVLLARDAPEARFPRQPGVATRRPLW